MDYREVGQMVAMTKLGFSVRPLLKRVGQKIRGAGSRVGKLFRRAPKQQLSAGERAALARSLDRRTAGIRRTLSGIGAGQDAAIHGVLEQGAAKRKALMDQLNKLVP